MVCKKLPHRFVYYGNDLDKLLPFVVTKNKIPLAKDDFFSQALKLVKTRKSTKNRSSCFGLMKKNMYVYNMWSVGHSAYR